MSQARTNQGGSVVSFVVIGVVLVALVVGGVYTLRQRNGVDTPVAVEPSASPSPTTAPSDSKSPAPAPSQSTQPQPSTAPSGESSSSSGTAPQDMPAAGPTDNLMTGGIVAAALVGIGVSYTRSRQAYNQAFSR